MKAPRESDILKACLQYLQLRGCFVWRANSGAMRATNRAGKERFIRFAGVVGLSDIIGLTPGGIFIACEVKRPGNVPTAAQQSFLDAVRRAGGIALCVTSVADLERQLEEAGV